MLLDCGHMVPIGGAAFEQQWYQVKVSGTTVTREKIVKIVCEDCAKDVK